MKRNCGCFFFVVSEEEKMKRNILVILFIMVTISFSYGENINFEEADLNRDGYIYIDDMEILQKDLMTLAAPYRGDINDDNYVNSEDLFILINIIINQLPEKTINELTDEQLNLLPNFLLSFIRDEFKKEDIEKLKKVLDYIEKNRDEFKIRIENEEIKQTKEEKLETKENEIIDKEENIK